MEKYLLGEKNAVELLDALVVCRLNCDKIGCGGWVDTFCLCGFKVPEVVGIQTDIAMASANVTLENQLHSAQKNLLFLQQDHANTLKGLHAEIRRLQQQCTGERMHYQLLGSLVSQYISENFKCRKAELLWQQKII